MARLNGGVSLKNMHMAVPTLLRHGAHAVIFRSRMTLAHKAI